jgi:RNA polymerase sigma-70 factor, ECF subfamily
LHRNDVNQPSTETDFHSADRQLVARLVCGEANAWNIFVGNYGRLLRSRVVDVARSFGLANDIAAIDDVTADVFGALLANDIAALRAYAGRSSLTTYLAVIATRCATRGFARKRLVDRKQRSVSVPQLPETNMADDPTSVALQAEQRELIRSLLHELPEKQRQVVELFHLEGHSYSAISQALDMPIGSVGVTLQRAEAKLRQRLEPPS